MYEMLIMATDIIQLEIKEGDVETDVYRVLTDFNILKDKKEDGSKIYLIQDINTKEQFRFAIRSYVFPAGYGVSQINDMEGVRFDIE
jgi:hypothetical protein